MRPKDAEGVANSVDTDLIWVCTVCPGLSVRKLRIIMVELIQHYFFYFDHTVSILENADAGILWSYMVEETGILGGNHRPWTGDHYLVTCRCRGSKPGCNSDIEGFTPALSRPLELIQKVSNFIETETKRKHH